MTERFEEWCALYQMAEVMHLSPVRGDQTNINTLLQETLFTYLLDIVLKCEKREKSLIAVDSSVALTGNAFAEC